MTRDEQEGRRVLAAARRAAAKSEPMRQRGRDLVRLDTLMQPADIRRLDRLLDAANGRSIRRLHRAALARVLLTRAIRQGYTALPAASRASRAGGGGTPALDPSVIDGV